MKASNKNDPYRSSTKASGLNERVARDELLSRIEKFVTQFYLSGEDLTPDQISKIYAPHVYYFGRRLSRSSVVNDKRAYYRRWPSRSFTLVPNTLTIVNDETRSRVSISFAYDFVARSKARRSTGRGVTTLILDLSTPDGQIVRETGHVIRRG